MSTSGTAGFFIDDLYSAYSASGTHQIPYAYSQTVTEVTRSMGDNNVIELAGDIKYNAYSTRNKQTISTSIVTLAGVAKTYHTLTAHLFLWDLFPGTTTPWTLGLSRGVFTFEDTPVLELSLTGVDDGSGNFVIKDATDGQYLKLTLRKFGTVTGKLRQTIDVLLLAGVATMSDFWIDMASVAATAAGDYQVVDKFYALSYLNDFVVKQINVTDYLVLNALAHKETYYEQLWDGTVFSEKVHGRSRIIQSPVQFLPQISAMDPGNYSQTPFGDTALEAVARLLSITYSNRNHTTQTGCGAQQMLEAVTADVQNVFTNDSVNAGVNFADLRTLFLAVQSYYPVMAAQIVSDLRLPKFFTSYIVALLDYYMWYVISTAEFDNALDLALDFIKQDYSMSNSSAELKTFLQTYQAYMCAGGVLYTTTTGDNIYRLGITPVSISALMSSYQTMQLDRILNGIEREKNLILAQNQLQGTLQVLDKSIILEPGVKYTVYTGTVSVAVVCTGYTITLNAANATFTTNMEYVKSV